MILVNKEIQACVEYTYLVVIFYVTGNDNNEIVEKILQARKMVGCLNKFGRVRTLIEWKGDTTTAKKVTQKGVI